METGKGHRSHAHGREGPRPPPAYLTGPGSPSIQLTTWNFSRSQKLDGPAEESQASCWFLRRPGVGKPAFLQTLAHPPPGQGLLSMLEVDTGLGSRHPSKAQDAGARKLESGERCGLGPRLA